MWTYLCRTLNVFMAAIHVRAVGAFNSGNLKTRQKRHMHRRYARCWCHLTLHIINIEKNVSRLLFHFFFFLICVCIPWVWLGWRWWGVFYLCLHTVGLVRMEVVWVCFDVLFYISEFHFLFLLIFILFWLVVYICVVGVFL